MERSETVRLARWLLNPRTLRILVWLVVCAATLLAAVYVAINWRGRQAWNRMQRELQSAGERVDLAAYVPPPVPDEQNFAMTPFLAPLFDFQPGTQTWRDTNAATRTTQFGKDFPNHSSKTDGWTVGKTTDLAAWAEALKQPADTSDPSAGARAVLAALQPYEPVLAELEQASRRPHARFNVRYDHPDPTSILLPHLSVLRTVTHILALRASARLALGESAAALDDILLALRAADTIKDEPMLIPYLVRSAARVRAVQAIWDGLAQRRWSEPELARLQAELQHRDLWEGTRLAMQGERAFGHEIIALVRRDPDLLPQLGAVDLASGGPARPPWFARFVLNCIPRGWFDLEEVEYDRFFRATLLSHVDIASRRINPAALDQAEQALHAELRSGLPAILRHQAMCGMLLPALPRVYQKAARAQTITDQAMLACALERHRLAHGQFPASLEALVPSFIERLPSDIIKGGPLHYRRSDEDRFALYSIGWNGVDDGGEPGLTDKGKHDPVKGDWLWRSP